MFGENNRQVQTNSPGAENIPTNVKGQIAFWLKEETADTIGEGDINSCIKLNCCQIKLNTDNFGENDEWKGGGYKFSKMKNLS